MGSKNLKAIVVKGSGSIKVAHPQRFMTVAGKIRKKYEKAKTFQNFHRYGTLFNYDAKQENCGFPFKNFQSQCLPGELFNSINPHKMIDKFKVASKNYPGCPIGCGHILHINEGPYSGLIAQCNQMEVMGTIQTRLAVMEPTFMVMANAICNQLGLDVDAAGGAIGWAMECYQRGIIDEGDTDGLSLKWGNEDVILKLIKKIGYKDGFGELLAEGSSKASELIGRGSNYYAMHIKGQELYETLRGSIGWCLGTTTSTRGGGHTTGTVIDSRAGYDENDANKARQIYGITSPHLPLEYDGKAKMVLYMEALHRVSNSLGICHMNTIWWDIALMDIVDMAELYSAATGWETTDEDLKIIAMKQINLEKALNLRHTKFDRKDDLPTLRDFSEPIPEGKLSGWKLDENKFNKVLDEYYELHGWDKETSYPTRETLVNLGLKYVADELGKNGKIS
jgi:aldehyde:ferredoxin oxidoreductase